MSRPLRIEYPGALYHVTSRGNVRDDIYLCDEDREKFLELCADEVGQQGWRCYAYCLMDNHYHLLLETPEGNLSRGMQRLNGRYTQYFNHKHQRVGHLFQGRYKAILVEKDAYLQELCRYVVLNPVRAGMVKNVSDWSWSSYSATCGAVECNAWLAVTVVQSLFGDSPQHAIAHYQQFIEDGVHMESPWKDLRGQICLGHESFANALQSQLDNYTFDRDIIRNHRKFDRPQSDDVLHAVMQQYGMDKEAVLNRRNKSVFHSVVFLLRRACNLRLKDVSLMVGVSEGRISQICRVIKDADWNNDERSLFEKFRV